MNLVSELQNDLALTFLVEKRHSEELDSNDVIELIDQIRKALVPLSESDRAVDRYLAASSAGKISVQ